MNTLVSIIESGFPELRCELPTALHAYIQFHDHLYTIDGVIIYKDHIVNSPQLCDNILGTLHSAHQSMQGTSMIAHTETSVYWPGITPAIKAAKDLTCNHCNCMAPSQSSAPRPHQFNQNIHSSTSALTSSTTRGLIIWL